MMYLVVTATVTSLLFCNGNAVDSEAVVQRPSSPGSVQLRSVKHESVAPTRRGSLTFKFDDLRGQKSPHGKLDHLASL